MILLSTKKFYAYTASYFINWDNLGQTVYTVQCTSTVINIALWDLDPVPFKNILGIIDKALIL